MSLKIKLNQSYLLIIKCYALALTVFSVFRAILFSTELNRINFQEAASATIFKAFIMGLRFDLVITGYIMFIPALIIFITDLFKLRSRVLLTILFYFIYILFVISFIICAADIPYFNQFYDRFSIGAFEWMDNSSFVFQMIIQEPKYFLISIPCILLSIFFFITLRRSFRAYQPGNYSNVPVNSLLCLLVLATMFLGIRGRIAKKSPIRIGTAYFSDNSFLNKLGLNPVFTLMRSYLDSQDSANDKIQLMPNEMAIEKVRDFYAIQNKNYESPIARANNFDSTDPVKHNVVVIMMESMSAAKMERHGNRKQLTPFLDSLADRSIYFENFYTAGKHTFNGIFSTLFSFPALYRQHPMKKIKEYDGISTALKKYGYSTSYYTTHDSQFDNVEGFLRANDFDYVISQKDYPSEEVKTTLGVPDDFMFKFSIPKINDLSKEQKPFFVSFMTASDHGPYYIPDYFKPRSEDIKEQIIEYADWSLESFMNLASKQDWYHNTIFVFLADHGAPLGSSYDIALNYFHSPLLIYSPDTSIIKQEKLEKIANQIDVFPTIMGALKLPYTNNTLGVDLLQEDRRYSVINDDDKIGILDSSFLCIMKDKGETLSLFNYKTKSRIDLSEKYPANAQEMALYAKSLMQVHQYMINEDLTSLQNSKELLRK